MHYKNLFVEKRLKKIPWNYYGRWASFSGKFWSISLRQYQEPICTKSCLIIMSLRCRKVLMKVQLSTHTISASFIIFILWKSWSAWSLNFVKQVISSSFLSVMSNLLNERNWCIGPNQHIHNINWSGRDKFCYQNVFWKIVFENMLLAVIAWDHQLRYWSMYTPKTFLRSVKILVKFNPIQPNFSVSSSIKKEKYSQIISWQIKHSIAFKKIIDNQVY